MGRFSRGGSYGHKIYVFDWGYRLSWTVDRYYSGSRLRHPRTTTKDTDEAGAAKFAKKWSITIPVLAEK